MNDAASEPSPHDEMTLREVLWEELFPGLLLLRTVRIALRFRILLLAALALLVATTGFRLIGNVFDGSDDPFVREDLELRSLATAVAPISTEPRILAAPYVGEVVARAPLAGVWTQIAAPYRGLVRRGISWTALVYLLMGCLWTAVVWGLAGGAICRMAALELTRDEPLGIRNSLRFTCRKWRDYLSAPLLPLVVTLLGLLLLALVGLLLRIDEGLLLGGLLWPLVLVGGLLLALVLLGLLVGWPLMPAAISSEGSDAFDALSRMYDYVYHRPLHLLLYVFFASLLGVLGGLVVDVFAGSVLELGKVGVSWGSGAERIREVEALSVGEAVGYDWMANSGGRLIGYCESGVRLLQRGFRYGFFWTVATAIYLLLRKQVDDTELDEVFVERAAEAYGLPPLTRDAAGVPGVADEPEEESAETGDAETGEEDSAEGE